MLSGTLGLANPETGEFCIAKEGEALFFRKETWHHGFNLGNEQVRVLESFGRPKDLQRAALLKRLSEERQ